MENESKKSNIKIGTLLLLLLLTILVTAVTTAFVYQKVVRNNSNTTSLENNEKRLETSISSKNLNTVKEEDITISKETEIKEDIPSVQKEIPDKIMELSTGIYLNENWYPLNIISKRGEWIEKTWLLEKNFDIIFNGKRIGIEQNISSALYEMPEIGIIKSKENIEYMLLKINRDYIANGPGTLIYIINEDAEVIGKLEETGHTVYTIGVKRDSEGEIIDFGTTVGVEIYEDSIVMYKGNNGVEKHKYTIVNEKIIDTIEKTYTFEESGASGKEGW